MSYRCPVCGEEISPLATKCIHCEAIIKDAKLCPYCAQTLPRHARKCIHCDEILTFRRYLQVGNSTLAILTALIAVVGATAPQLKALFHEKSSDLKISFVRTRDDESLEFLVSNKGLKDGIVVDGKFRVRFGKAPKQLAESKLFFPSHQETGVVSGGQYKFLSLAAAGTKQDNTQDTLLSKYLKIHSDKMPADDTCVASLRTENLDLVAKNVLIPLNCETIVPVILHIANSLG